MDAAVLTELGTSPKFGEFAEPVAADGLELVEVAAAGVNHLDLAKASGTFYAGPPEVPSVFGRLADPIVEKAQRRTVRANLDTLAELLGHADA
jgi:NADPH:quinone reductase-like Zn-dependent oxidoreductase